MRQCQQRKRRWIRALAYSRTPSQMHERNYCQMDNSESTIRCFQENFRLMLQMNVCPSTTVLGHIRIFLSFLQHWISHLTDDLLSRDSWQSNYDGTLQLPVYGIRGCLLLV